MGVATRQSSLIDEALAAIGGTWRLLLGRADAGYHFDFSQRGLAGSFVPLVMVNAVMAGLMGMTGQGPSPAMQLFSSGLLLGLRYGAMRMVLPQLKALHAFRPFMVASNWSGTVVLMAALVASLGLGFIAAMLLGPAAGDTIVGLILTLWAGVALAMLVIEINIYRLVVGLNFTEIVIVVMAQFVALLAGGYILSQFPFSG
ncbi:hypothetical protein SAMN04487974_104245 [Pelagibacterium luteolum]|uniref:Yip1 domain-containing protein n=1 Tax=Pelagibacterium luteolum TaxID=440168 RepID=A0A1G7VN47_9HYPH|nr:hypothetical protein SAMN04487974_104245 [Pelagibacterium luteolum]